MLKRIRIRCIKLILCLILLFPMLTYAHLIAITLTTPFPGNIPLLTPASATFTVTNTTTTVPLIIVNQTELPLGSGLYFGSSTCNGYLMPRTSCQIEVGLLPASVPGTFPAILKLWAKPSLDAVQLPFAVVISNEYVITPINTAGGTINPNTPQSVSAGASITFTATPNAGYGVAAWLVDGSVAQVGGTTFTLSNVRAPHTVEASFVTFIITPSAGSGGAISPNTPQNVSPGSSITFTATPNAGYYVDEWLLDGSPAQAGGTSYTLTDVTASHTVEVTFAAPIAVAAGASGANVPLLAVSIDGGSTWGTKSINGVPATGILYAAACSGMGSQAICTTAGAGSSNQPILAESVDGGNTWNTISITGAPSSAYLYATSCVGTGASAICAASGEIATNPYPPIIAVSTNGGSTWATINVTGLPSSYTGSFESISCTGSGSTAVCAAVGGYINGNEYVLIANSRDGGNTWNNRSVTGLSLGYFVSTSCTGNGNSATCIAVGESTSSSPILALSTDGGNTWTAPTLPNLTSSGSFESASCTGGDSGTAICIAAGQDTNTNAPLLYASTDGGMTWVLVNIPGAPTAGVFYGASCAGSGNTAVCVVAGQDTNASAPYLASSTDGATTWSSQTISGVTGAGIFQTASCTDTNNILCIAAGQLESAPLVAVGSGGMNWTTVTITGAPASGNFYGSGTTGGTLLTGQRKRFGIENTLRDLLMKQ